MKKSLYAFPVFFSLVFISCADKITSECSDSDTSTDGFLTARYSDIQAKVFTPTCAVTGCHAGSQPQEGLDLSASKAYQNLVNAKSRQKPELFRIKPGDAANSYIIHKISANDFAVMPPTGRLAAAIIDSVRAWIDQGALDN